MRAYYNEIDPYCCARLSYLMDAGHITRGRIDDRPIQSVRPDDLAGYSRAHFFAGIGGWDLALNLAGWGDAEVWTGSCPCTPFSVAGKRLGTSDARHLWPFWADLIRERTPAVLFGEQSAAASDWLALVRSDLEEMDYAVGAIPIEAASAGARHRRDRFWIVADSQRDQQPRQEPRSGPAGRVGRVIEPFPWHEPWESALSRFRVLGDGLPRSVGATDAARNAIVPQVAAQFIGAYLESRRAA